MNRPCTVLWTSEPLVIGKHEWRIVVGDFLHLVAIDRAIGRHNTNGRATFYEWRPLAYRGNSRDWRDEREWPTYDGDRSDCGIPRTLRKLWERERTTIRALLQPVLAGQAAAAKPQLDLFDTTGAAP